MSKENDAPPPTPDETTSSIINEYYTICYECSSSIEILSINEQNIKFRCTKQNKEFPIMSIKEYLKKVEEYKEKNENDLKDKCEKHKNNNYVSYCYECNCHLCDECLKTSIHINHKKSNIIEIKPMKLEINIIKEVINDYNKRLEKERNEKENKTKKIKEELEKEKINEENKLKNIIKINKNKEIEELNINNNEYIKDIEEIKREYEEKIKLRRNKYINERKNINNKYKLLNEEENIKYKIKIDRLNNKFDNIINNFNFDNKIENYENMLKINKTIYNIYNLYNNNYYNGINMNNLLLYYSKNKYINDNIMKKILKDNYDKIINKINIKNNNILNKEIKNEKMKNEIEEKYKNEINTMKKKVNQNIYYLILFYI